MATPEDADARRMTVGELKRLLAARGAPWTVDEDLPDAAPIPTHPGGISSNSFRFFRAAARVAGVRRLDFAALLRARPPTNAFLVQQAVELGFLHDRFLRGTAPADVVVRGQHMVDRLAALRPYVMFPPAPGRAWVTQQLGG